MSTSPDRDRAAGNGDTAPDFETALSELEQIVQQLEAGSIGLEQSLARFEEGIGLLRRCYETLENAEQRIELLTGFDADGNPVTTRVELSVTVEQTEVARETRPAPRQRSVEQRLVADGEDNCDDYPTLF